MWLILNNRWFQGIAGLLLAFVIYTIWKGNIESNYEDEVQVEVKEQVTKDAKEIKETFDTDSDAIIDSVDGMLSKEASENKLRSIEADTTDADNNSERDIDMESQNGVRYMQPEREGMPEVLPEIIYTLPEITYKTVKNCDPKTYKQLEKANPNVEYQCIKDEYGNEIGWDELIYQ